MNSPVERLRQWCDGVEDWIKKNPVEPGPDFVRNTVYAYQRLIARYEQSLDLGRNAGQRAYARVTEQRHLIKLLADAVAPELKDYDNE